MERYRELLSERFGLQQFRPGQEAVIQSLLAGRSALAVFPTGAGKSLCYQLPALLLDGLTLVVSPLIALMKDQVDQLNALHIPAARLDSSLDYAALQTVYADLDAGTTKLLYVSPERLSNERFLQRLQRWPIVLMAVDEAHCISEWGHNFRPDYLKLSALVSKLKIQRVLALTATATPDVSRQICQHFRIAETDFIQTGFYRSNLALSVRVCASEHRDQLLLDRINTCRGESAIIYVTQQKTAESLAEFFSRHDRPALPYHAGLKGERRHQIQDDFMAGRCSIVVATIAFGMGIDKADIRAIYHYNLPKSLENYMQETGRAGRDGLPAHCELLASGEDLTVLENFVYGDTPDGSSVWEFIQWLLDQAEQFDLSVYQTAYQFDVRPLVLTTLLTYLELEGVITATAPFYSAYKLQFLSSPDSIVARFNPQRAAFLQQLFATGRRGRIWVTITPEEASAQLGENRQRISKALNYLEEQGLIKLQVAGARQGYRLHAADRDSKALSEKMVLLFQQRESRDIERLHQVCDWIETTGCYQQALLRYFGEELERPCGRCSACNVAEQGLFKPLQLPHRQSEKTDPAIIFAIVKTIRGENHQALIQSRQLARFLCGINSPQASRARLGRHPLFAALADSPFATVLDICNKPIENT